MGLSFKKKTIFGSKTKKIAANFCNRRIQTVCLRTFPTSPPIKGQKHTRRRNEADEFAAMMEGWNSKHLSFFSFHTNSFFSFTQILSHKSKIPRLCTRTQMENHWGGWRARSNSTKFLFSFFHTNSFTQIKDLRSVYSDTDGKLLLRVEGKQQLDKVVVSSQKIDGTTTYECEVCHKFQGDSKAMRQHMAGHDLQSAGDWFARYQVLKPEFPCLLCGIRNSHGVNPGKDSNALDGCFMWFETKNSQPTHYCKLVQEMKPYGSWASANKCRWKFANRKDSKPPEPSSNLVQEYTAWTSHPQWDLGISYLRREGRWPAHLGFPERERWWPIVSLCIGASPNRKWQVQTHRDKCLIKCTLDS